MNIILPVGLGFNVLSFIFTIIALCLPWYSISFKGKIDNQSYNTKADFKLLSYSCSYYNDHYTLQYTNKPYGGDEGPECFPIVPPTASLFGLGIGFFIGLFFICVSLIPSIAGIILQISMIKLPKFGLIWVRISVMILSIVTIVFYVFGFLFNGGTNKGLQSYNSDDTQSTSSDEFTAKMCEDFWCTSFHGEGNYSPLAQSVNSIWGPATGFYMAIISCVFTLFSGILTLFYSIPKDHHHRGYTSI